MTGTMPDNGGVVIVPSTITQAIATGYHNGAGTVQGDPDLAAPNINELRSLFDPGQPFPYLPADHPFTGVQTDPYWSSTTDAVDTSYAWQVHPGVGVVGSTDKPFPAYVWPVRGGQ